MGPLACRNAQCSEPAARTVRETYRALMTNRRDTLSKSETVTIAAIEQGIPLLVEAREIIAGFHAIERIYLRDSSHGNHGRRLLHMSRFHRARTSSRLPRPRPSTSTSSRLRQAPDAKLAETQPHRAAATRRSQSHEAGGGVLSQVRRRSRGAQTRAWLPMAQVDDLAGLQDGFFPKLIFPDAPNGRQSRWETLDLVVQALFGTGYRMCAGQARCSRRSFCAGHALEAQKNILRARPTRCRGAQQFAARAAVRHREEGGGDATRKATCSKGGFGDTAAICRGRSARSVAQNAST